MTDNFLLSLNCNPEPFWAIENFSWIKCPSIGIKLNGMPEISINLIEGRKWKIKPENYFVFPPITNQTTQRFGYYGLDYLEIIK